MDYYDNTRNIVAALATYQGQEAFNDVHYDTDDHWDSDEFDSDDDVLNDHNDQHFPQPPIDNDDIYDRPQEEEIKRPVVNRSSKPIVRKAETPLPIQPEVNAPIQNLSSESDDTQVQPVSVANRKAMFNGNHSLGSSNVPSPFRTNSKFGQQGMLPPFGSRPTQSPAKASNFNIQRNNNDANNNNNKNIFNQQNHKIDNGKEEIYELGDEEEYEEFIEDGPDSMYIDPADPHCNNFQHPLEHNSSTNSRPSRGLPPVPTSGAVVSPVEFLQRINTIKKTHLNHQAPLPLVPSTEDDTYDVCGEEMADNILEPINRQRIDSNSSRTSLKSNSSSSSSREDSFRVNQPRSPMENRPLPIPHQEQQETYEIITSAPAPGSRPPMPLPNGHSGASMTNRRQVPPPRGKKHSTDHSRRLSVDRLSVDRLSVEQPDEYDYCEEHVSPALQSQQIDCQGISIPPEDEYEMPPESSIPKEQTESLQFISPDDRLEKVEDIPPDPPMRSEDPRRITPPLRPPKELHPQTLATAPLIHELRLQKPRHSFDVGMEQGTRKSPPVIPEKSRSGSDTVATTTLNKRPVPPPPTGQKPKQLPQPTALKPQPTNPKPQPTALKPQPTNPNPQHTALKPPSTTLKPSPILPHKTQHGYKPDFPIVSLDVLRKNPVAVDNSLHSPSHPTEPALTITSPPQLLPFKPSGFHRFPNKAAEVVQPPPKPFGNMCRPNSDPVDDNLANNSWYCRYLNRQQSERILKERNMEGGFIVRDTDRGSGYSISIYHAGAVTHLRVPLNNGQFYLGTSPQGFSSVPALVRFFMSNKIALKTGGEVILKL